MSTSRRNQIKALQKRCEFLEKQVDGLNEVVFCLLCDIDRVVLDLKAFNTLDHITHQIFDWQRSLRLRNNRVKSNNGINSEDTDD